MKANTILDTIGNTPHIRVQKLFPDTEVWIKSERANPGASIKDRIALAMVEAAEASGQLKPGGTIVEPTSGNTGIGLAIVAETDGAWMPQQFENPANLEVHRRTTAQEILADFRDSPLDALITGVGT